MSARGLRKKFDLARQGPVSRLSDAQLRRTVGTRLGMRLLFAGMRRIYRPDKAKGFRGEIEFSLDTPHGVEIWTMTCMADRAKMTRGPAGDPQLRLRAEIADFLRVATGGLDPGRALVAGRLGIRGDFGLAVRLGELFGGKAFF